MAAIFNAYDYQLSIKMKNILEIDSVLLSFNHKRILQDIYLKSETGKIAGLLGRNGSGKSCLMKIIFGELTPEDKSIRINERALTTNYRSHLQMNYLPQFQFTPNSITVKRVFKDFDIDFSAFIAWFPSFKKCYVTRLKNLSGGERRIIEIYAILMAKSRFCMLDEPFSQVMPLHIESIKQLIVRQKMHKGIIITDHLYDHIIDICDTLYVLKDGKTHLTKHTTDLEKLGYVRNLNK